MSTDSDGSVKPTTDAPPKKETRRLQTNVRSLVVLVGCCGAVLWAWRYLAENSDPVRNEGRKLQIAAINTLRSSKKQADRLASVYDLERLHEGDVSIRVSALIELLDDTDIEVRVAAVDALGNIASTAAGSGSADPSLGDAAIALARRAKDSNAPFRRATIKNMGTLGASLVKSRAGRPAVAAVANALLDCLNDPEPAVRSTAASSLGELNTPTLAAMTTPSLSQQTLTDALSRLLSDGDEGVRLAVIMAMAAQPAANDPPTSALATGLKDPSPKIRAAAVQRLGFFSQGLDPWTPVLLRLAEQDPEPSVREQCLRTLSYGFKPPAITAVVVPTLTLSLKGSVSQIRSQSALLLGRFGPDARAAIPVLLQIVNEPLAPNVDPTEWTQYMLDPASLAIDALGEIAPGSTEEKKVIAALMDVAENGPDGRRGWVVIALGKFGSAASEAVPFLIKFMNDSAADNKSGRFANSARALGQIAPESPSADLALAALLNALDSKTRAIRSEVVEPLGRFGAKAAPAIPKLRAVINDRKSERFDKDAATKALKAIESDQGAP